MRQQPEHAEPRTIAYVIFGLACGGAEMVLLELVKGLDRRRFRPVVISLAPRAALSQQFEQAEAEVHHLGLRRLAAAPIVFAKALQLVRRIQPDVLHGVLFYGDITARLIRLFQRGPRVVSAIHSTYVGPAWCAHALRFTDPLADAVTAVSQVVADARLKAGTVKPDKLTVIPNGIDLQRFEQPPEAELARLRTQLKIAPTDRVLLCVGRLEPEKNHALLLRAFARITEEFPRARLLLVGSGSLAGTLEEQAETLGIRARVVFAGELSPIGPVFHLAEVFVLASWLEGLPMVVLEAMAAALPMVLTSVGGIPEVAQDGRTAWLVPPNDERGFELALRRALSMAPEARQAVGAAARREVFAKFGVERMVDSTQALYDSLLDVPRLAQSAVLRAG